MSASEPALDCVLRIRCAPSGERELRLERRPSGDPSGAPALLICRILQNLQRRRFAAAALSASIIGRIALKAYSLPGNMPPLTGLPVGRMSDGQAADPSQKASDIAGPPKRGLQLFENRLDRYTLEASFLTHEFGCLFSASSSFTRTGSETLSPPYSAFHLGRVRVGSG